MSGPSKLVLLRHGQSEWNRLHRLTGWADVGLSRRGEFQAATAASLLLAAAYEFDEVYCSELLRARSSAEIVLSKMNCGDLPITYSWRLNERHYGALEGLGPISAAFKFGLRQVVQCQRRFNVSPPPLSLSDSRYPGNQVRFAHVPESEWPRAESMAQTWERTRCIWERQIAPAIKAGRRVLVVSHKNTLRVLIKHLCGYSEQKAERLSIRTGRPLVFELDEKLRSTRDYVLDDRS